MESSVQNSQPVVILFKIEKLGSSWLISSLHLYTFTPLHLYICEIRLKESFGERERERGRERKRWNGWFICVLRWDHESCHCVSSGASDWFSVVFQQDLMMSILRRPRSIYAEFQHKGLFFLLKAYLIARYDSYVLSVIQNLYFETNRQYLCFLEEL